MKDAQVFLDEYFGEGYDEDQTGWIHQDVLLAMREYALVCIEEFQALLVAGHYCDADVYSEPPSPIDQYITSHK